MEPLERLKISTFRAWDEPQLSRQYLQEHFKVLHDVGVIDALPHDPTWCDDENCVVIVAEHPVLGMVGGCRIQIGGPQTKLPYEQCLRTSVPDLSDRTRHLISDTTGELCGLWVVHRFLGHGLPWLLTSAAVSILSQLTVGTTFCLAADYSAQYALHNGFKVVKEIGQNGGLQFPIPSIRSFLLVLRDPIHLSAANENDRQRMLSLRITPVRSRTEVLKDRSFEVYYDLKLRERIIPMNRNGSYEGLDERRTA